MTAIVLRAHPSRLQSWRPPGLLEQHDLGDLDAALESLDHVVDGQRRDRRRRHRLHLDARLRARARLGLDLDEAVADLDAHVGERERQGVAKRDQLGRLLGGLDARDPRGRDDVALGRVTACDRRGGIGRHAHDGARDRAPVRHLLGAHVDHPGAPGLVEVRQLPLGSHAPSVPPLAQACACVLWAAAIRSRTASSSPRRRSSTGSGSPFTIDSKKSLRSW